MTPKPAFIATCLALAGLAWFRPLFAEENRGFFLQPWYEALAQAGSEDGGLRDERREQNRARLVHRIGMDANYFVNQSSLVALRAGGQALHDFHYYNARSQRHEDGLRLSEVWLTWCKGASMATCKKPIFFFGRDGPGTRQPGFGTPMTPKTPKAPKEADRKSFGKVSKKSSKEGTPLRPDIPRDSRTGVLGRPPGWSFRLGRSLWAADQSGLFFTGESPLLYAGLRLPVKTGKALHLRAGTANIERENRARRGLPDSQRIKARYYMLFGDYESKELFIGFHYGFYRSPGRAARPDWSFSAQLPEPFSAHRPSWKIPVGQNARADADVHYYGIFPEWRQGDWQLRARLWHNYGRLIAVDRAGTRIRSSRKSVQGSLAWGEFARGFGAQRQAEACPLEWIRRGGCLQSAPQDRSWQIALGGIYATRDRDSADKDLNGFGSLRPSPAVLGGGASVFLTGPPPGIERPAFQNTQPQGPFSDGGREPYIEPRHFRDNSDSAPPDYSNDGLRMAGFRASYLLAGSGRLRAQFFANYAALRYGVGREAVVSLSGRLPSSGTRNRSSYCPFPARKGTKNPGGLLCSFRPQLAWQIFATAASYSPAKREVEAYTGLSQRTPTRFYSRVQALLSFWF